MKTNNLFVVSAMVAGLSLTPVGRLRAQTLPLTALHTFSASDGAVPYAGLLRSGNTLYGTTESEDGTSGYGTVFKLNTDRSGFTNLHIFNGSDGASPNGGLILDGNTLYGTTHDEGVGGPSGNGTVFKVSTDGTAFLSLHDFTGGFDGAYPSTSVTLSGDTLYGSAWNGGSSGFGTLFKVKTNGTDFTVVHSFTALSGSLGVAGTNSDGANPRSALIISGNTLYGATANGGRSGFGTLFRVNTDGSGFTNLHSFTATGPADPSLTNSEGWYPRSGLVLSGTRLYGMAQFGGTGAAGSVFAVNTDGTGFTNLHSFTAGSGSYPSITNSDGAYPRAGLVLSGNTVYGAAAWGGSLGGGTLFAINTNGTGLKVLFAFEPAALHSPNGTGAYPYGQLVLSDNALYGTTLNGGDSGHGTVFKLSLPAPQLTVIPSGTNAVVAWPVGNAGFDFTGYALRTATNLVPPVAWSSDSASAVVVNGLNTVTNAISGPQRFFRLSQ